MTETDRRFLNRDDLYAIARGACLLASGGGGTYESGISLADNFKEGEYYSNPFVEVVSPDEACTTGGWGIVTAYLGAPEAIKSAAYPKAAVAAVASIQARLNHMGYKLEYIVPAELGSLSSIVPCLVAAKLGLKVVDADGAARAVPELPMLTYAAQGISVNPTILANDDGIEIVLKVDEKGIPGGPEAHESAAAIIENIARPVVGIKEFRQIAGIAIWMMDPEGMAKALPIKGTLSMAKEVGEKIPDADADSIIDFLKSRCGLKAYRLFRGSFSEKGEGVASMTGGGFDHGYVTLTNKNSSERFVGIFQNETLIAWNSESDKPLAMAPDSIAYFVHDKQKVYSNGDIVTAEGKLAERLKDREATVIGIAAHPALRESESGLLRSAVYRKRASEGEIMRSFQKTLLNLGYGGKYVKIEDLWG